MYKTLFDTTDSVQDCLTLFDTGVGGQKWYVPRPVPAPPNEPRPLPLQGRGDLKKANAPFFSQPCAVRSVSLAFDNVQLVLLSVGDTRTSRVGASTVRMPLPL